MTLETPALAAQQSTLRARLTSPFILVPLVAAILMVVGAVLAAPESFAASCGLAA